MMKFAVLHWQDAALYALGQLFYMTGTVISFTM